jgi:hypothetical protein
MMKGHASDAGVRLRTTTERHHDEIIGMGSQRLTQQQGSLATPVHMTQFNNDRQTKL